MVLAEFGQQRLVHVRGVIVSVSPVPSGVSVADANAGLAGKRR